MRISAVVLASGESRRFGSGDKLIAPFRGAPLVVHTFDALPRELFAARLVVTRSDDIAALAREHGLSALMHSLPDVSDTIRLGIGEMRYTDGCLFCVGDQPYLSAETVTRITVAFLNDPTRIYRAACGAHIGNPVIFPRVLYGELAALAVGQSGGAVINRHAALVSLIEVASPNELLDIDTQEDYQRMECEGNAAHR